MFAIKKKIFDHLIIKNKKNSKFSKKIKKSMKYIILFTMVIAIFGVRIQDQWPITYNNNIMSVFSQIQERLKGGQPIDDIPELLNEIKTRVLEEGSKHTDV